VEAVMMHSLNSYLLHVRPKFFATACVCAGYVPACVFKYCTVGCFVMCGTWFRIPLKHSSLRAAVLCNYQQSTCTFILSYGCLYVCVFVARVGLDSAVGVATCYGLDGPGIESRWGRDFPQQSRRVVGPTVYNERLGSYPGTKQAGRDVSHLPQLAPTLKKE
jgi:hypothetical protein